jgi:pimeloyl-ACP methyl ester carboxylesterase
MATFVMIHGAWHGGWCFDPLRTLLEERGHRVIAPDLPGMGGDAQVLAAVALDGWASFTSGLCREADDPVILCGHSRGGIVVSQAAEVAPEAIAALVYICAMLLPSGLSRVDMKPLVAPNPDFEAIISPVPGGTVVDPARAPNIFAQLSPPTLATAAAARLVAEPSGPRATPLALTDGRYGTVPRHYIECLHDRTIPIADQRYMQSRQPCDTVTTLEADHSPFLSAPRALADALISIAEGVAR